MEGMDKRMKMKEKCLGCGGRLTYYEYPNIRYIACVDRVIGCEKCDKWVKETWNVMLDDEWKNGGRKRLLERYNEIRGDL